MACKKPAANPKITAGSKGEGARQSLEGHKFGLLLSQGALLGFGSKLGPRLKMLDLVHRAHLVALAAHDAVPQPLLHGLNDAIALIERIVVAQGDTDHSRRTDVVPAFIEAVHRWAH